MQKPDLPSPAPSNVLPFQRPLDDPIFKGSGGGGSDMLEARVGQLEKDVGEIKADVKVIRTDVAELKGKVSMLPGWGGLMVVTGVIVGGVGLLLRFLPTLPPSP